MASETGVDVRAFLRRAVRSGWWLAGSGAIPLVLSIGSALWLVNDAQRRVNAVHGEVDALTVQKEQLDRDLAVEKQQLAQAHDELTQAADALAGVKAEVAQLRVSKEALQQAQRDALTSTPPIDAAKVIMRVRAETAKPARERAFSLLREGEAALAKGHPDAARTLYEAAIAEDEHYAYPHIALGFMAINRGDMATAEKNYLAASAAEPNDPYALTALVNLYRGQKRFDEARTYAALLRALPKRPPEADEALNRLGDGQ